jgi:hypothetical protein
MIDDGLHFAGRLGSTYHGDDGNILVLRIGSTPVLNVAAKGVEEPRERRGENEIRGEPEHWRDDGRQCGGYPGQGQ